MLPRLNVGLAYLFHGKCGSWIRDGRSSSCEISVNASSSAGGTSIAPNERKREIERKERSRKKKTGRRKGGWHWIRNGSEYVHIGREEIKRGSTYSERRVIKRTEKYVWTLAAAVPSNRKNRWKRDEEDPRAPPYQMFLWKSEKVISTRGRANPG